VERQGRSTVVISQDHSPGILTSIPQAEAVSRPHEDGAGTLGKVHVPSPA